MEVSEDNRITEPVRLTDHGLQWLTQQRTN